MLESRDRQFWPVRGAKDHSTSHCSPLVPAAEVAPRPTHRGFVPRPTRPARASSSRDGVLKEEDQAVIYKVTVWLDVAKISEAMVDVLCSFSELLGQIPIIFAPLKR